MATGTYTDPGLRRLRAPARDAADLAQVLADPGIGGFTVTTVIDQPGQQIRLAIDDFLADRGTQDLLLVYLSCHGKLDDYRRLYFAATDTRLDRLGSTGVESAWVLDQLEHCRARRQVLILDCCFSGAFAHGAKGEADVGLQDRFLGQGRGRVVLTASTATEYSFEGEPTDAAGPAGSVFTAALVQGLRTGAADLDRDGHVSVDDAYAYVFDQVQAAGAAQTPQRWLYGAEGRIVLARSRAGGAGPQPVQVPTAVDAPAPDDEHYQMVVDEVEYLVLMLGARINSDDREGPYREGSGILPDDTDLAKYLAPKASLERDRWDLAEVAQDALLVRDERNVYGAIRELLNADAESAKVHKYLAHLPNRLEELGLQKRYPMIVTSQLDVALERAFLEEGEPFDSAIYMAPGTEYAGRFVHLRWGNASPVPILKANDYTDFPIAADDGRLTRTVIVRINGAVDDPAVGYPWKNNFMITQDHYLGYLGRPAEEVVPAQILAKLRESSCLFLGYAIANSLHRVFLHWIWGERLSGGMHWAVERYPSILEKQFWQRSGIALYKSSLTDYMKRLDKFLSDHRGELA